MWWALMYDQVSAERRLKLMILTTRGKDGCFIVLCVCLVSEAEKLTWTSLCTVRYILFSFFFFSPSLFPFTTSAAITIICAVIYHLYLPKSWADRICSVEWSSRVQIFIFQINGKQNSVQNRIYQNQSEFNLFVREIYEYGYKTPPMHRKVKL